MKESYIEGLATHDGPESCIRDRKETGEALTGVHVGWVLRRERREVQGADAVSHSGRQDPGSRKREVAGDPAR